jgi:uncharacterized protein (TIGR03032 family)
MERHTQACDVFISYAGFDRDLAAALAASLHVADVDLWWDANLSPDEPFEQQIQRILAATRVIVAILSPRALESEWVRWELSQAMQNGLHIVPLLVKGLRPEHVPPPLNLLPALVLPCDGSVPASLESIGARIRDLITTVKRRPARREESDARRRLASAAAVVARQAADIKSRNTGAVPRPAIVISDDHHRTEQARYTMSEGLVGFLREQNISIACSAFQNDELLLLGRTPTGELMINVGRFRKPTGLHVAGGRLLVATLAHVYRLENILGPDQRLDGTYSHCYVPRVGHFTGVLDAHDVGVTATGEAVFIATRYNCLATVSPVHSFKPLWRPSFISEIVAEDRCHLNGLAMADGTAAYVTAVAETDTYDGWRAQVARGGIVIDVATSAVVCRDLSMPHSPRLRGNTLWLLNSGAGELGYLSDARRFRPVAFCPGFVRGLAFSGDYAIVGLSRPRYDDFAGLELNDRLRDRGEEAWCGLWIIDMRSGEGVHWLRIDGQVRELYDVAVLPAVSCPRSVSDATEEALDLITIDA